MWSFRAFLPVVASLALLVPCSSSRHPSLRHSHHHHHRHRSSRHPHRRPSEDDNAYAAKLFRQLVDEESPPKTRRLSLAASLNAPDFPVAHPVVRQVLDGMEGSMDKLKEKRSEQKVDQEALLKSEDSAVAHIPDAVTMQHEIVRMQADLRVKDDKLLKLEEEAAGLQGEHDNLHVKLQAVMDPRILGKKEQLSTQEAILSKTENDLSEWKTLHEQYRDTANKKLQDRKDSLLVLHSSEDAIKAAEKEHDEAEATYEQARRDARKGVEQYKYVDVKYGAEIAKDKEVTEEVRKDRDAVTSLASIFKMEDQRIDESLFFSRDQLQTRINQAKASHVKTEDMLSALKKKYSAWQEEEEGLTAQAAKEKAAYGKSAEAYANERKDVLHAAQDAAGAQAVGNSDWADDDWGWAGGSNAGLSHLEEVPVAT